MLLLPAFGFFACERESRVRTAEFNRLQESHHQAFNNAMTPTELSELIDAWNAFADRYPASDEARHARARSLQLEEAAREWETRRKDKADTPSLRTAIRLRP
ncbi:MAG: hypothetical protein EA425_16570 [Puniceicoccaceae bacterium]|nr:MAG: hypothetical protein EA425_16570 [Puniceicoccaceae bacterium]